MNQDCQHLCQDPTPLKRGDGLFGGFLKLLLLYVLVVFFSGTLRNTGHPMAIEVGMILHRATFVDHAIRWADTHECAPIASVLRFCSHGFPVTLLN